MNKLWFKAAMVLCIVVTGLFLLETHFRHWRYSSQPARNETYSDTAMYQQNPDIKALMEHHRWYLFSRLEGRLGNVLFQLASVFCIAKLNNLTLVVSDVRELSELRYQGIKVRGKFWKQLFSLPVRRGLPATCCGFDSRVVNLKPRDSHHYLLGYFQSWRYFEPCKTEVKRAVLFKTNIVNKAVRIVAQLREKLPTRTLVGVHVRMEDYLTNRAITNGKKIAPPEYYTKAMNYFRSKFRNVTFVVTTSDPKWFRNKVTNASDVVVLSRSDSAAVDMEVLSRMDHIILSVGTFGWWSAYRNKGTVVCYRDMYVHGSKYSRQFWNNATDFFYPGWILM